MFVHGWSGKPLTGLANLVASRVGNDIKPMVFDYSKWSAYWASNDHIAPCLADYLHQVSDAYRAAGGDGRVLYVAHSMGGIAIRYAMDASKVSHPVTAAQVPWIITLDTPHLGSPWGGLSVAQGLELWKGIWGNAIPNPFGVDGGRCLALHSNGSQLSASCNGLPPWMAGGTTLYQVGGAITLRRTFLGIHLYDIPLNSDGIVDYSSQTGYSISGPGGRAPVVSSETVGTTVHSQRISCTVSTGQLGDILDSVGGLLSSSLNISLNLLGDWEALHRLEDGGHDPVTLGLDAAALLVAPCSHVGITGLPDAVSQISVDIRAILNAATFGDGKTIFAPVPTGWSRCASPYGAYIEKATRCRTYPGFSSNAGKNSVLFVSAQPAGGRTPCVLNQFTNGAPTIIPVPPQVKSGQVPPIAPSAATRRLDDPSGAGLPPVYLTVVCVPNGPANLYAAMYTHDKETIDSDRATLWYVASHMAFNN